MNKKIPESKQQNKYVVLIQEKLCRLSLTDEKPNKMRKYDNNDLIKRFIFY
jgi:hypothetical protein